MLSSRLDTILTGIRSLTIGVVGDLFLDRYLDLDASLTEPSVETGLAAYQVVKVRAYPGAAGTVINNLASLGVREIFPVAIIGDDGEGHELRQALRELRGVNCEDVVSWPGRRTPTYTKPMLHQAGQPPRELNRLDIKNRTPLPREAEDRVIRAVDDLWPRAHALVVLDQVSELDCGVITSRVREHLAERAGREPEKIVLADSRERIGLFRNMWLKPNRRECLQAVGKSESDLSNLSAAVDDLARRAGRPVFCTCGAAGILVVDPRPQSTLRMQAPGIPVNGPIDPVGAGDSVSAALACALAAGASLNEAAAFANLVASITIQQIGVTGTATPQQVQARREQTRPS